MNPYTYAGSVLAICVTPQNSDLVGTSPGFAGLIYVDIGNVGNVGAYGLNTNMVSYPVLDRALVLKAKGQTDGGNFTFQCADDPTDAGQIAVAAAADPESQDNYALRITLATGGIHYLRGPVGGPNHPGGGNEAFVVNEYTFGVNEILEVAPV